jgi:hypothetical protein
MKCIVELGSGGMMCIPSFMNIIPNLAYHKKFYKRISRFKFEFHDLDFSYEIATQLTPVAKCQYAPLKFIST